MHITNDWELYGDGSGDFYELQVDRLNAMINALEYYDAKVTLFADVAQQWAHQEIAPSNTEAKSIVEAWENSVEDALARGHDVQLHLHPPWLQAEWKGDRWSIPASNWQMIGLTEDGLEDLVRRGRLYLESIGRAVKPGYRCNAFRANAYTIQPLERTLPALKRAGISTDSSVVSGCWDYMNFDFRGWNLAPGAYMTAEGVIEMQIATVAVNDRPWLRRLAPNWWSFEHLLGTTSDPEYLAWAKVRDAEIRRKCAILDPLHRERQKHRFALSQWKTYWAREHHLILDYDFMSPDLFLAGVKQNVARAHPSVSQLDLVAVGHCKNAHSTKNLERTLALLHKVFGRDITFSTFSETNRRISNPSPSAHPQLEVT